MMGKSSARGLMVYGFSVVRIHVLHVTPGDGNRSAIFYNYEVHLRYFGISDLFLEAANKSTHNIDEGSSWSITSIRKEGL